MEDEDEEGHEPCPKCGGKMEFRAYDDGDNIWDEAWVCVDCDYHDWL